MRYTVEARLFWTMRWSIDGLVSKYFPQSAEGEMIRKRTLPMEFATVSIAFTFFPRSWQTSLSIMYYRHSTKQKDSNKREGTQRKYPLRQASHKCLTATVMNDRPPTNTPEVVRTASGTNSTRSNSLVLCKLGPSSKLLSKDVMDQFEFEKSSLRGGTRVNGPTTGGQTWSCCS